jgi:hypothetical protein
MLTAPDALLALHQKERVAFGNPEITASNLVKPLLRRPIVPS